MRKRFRHSVLDDIRRSYVVVPWKRVGMTTYRCKNILEASQFLMRLAVTKNIVRTLDGVIRDCQLYGKYEAPGTMSEFHRKQLKGVLSECYRDLVNVWNAGILTPFEKSEAESDFKPAIRNMKEAYNLLGGD